MLEARVGDDDVEAPEALERGGDGVGVGVGVGQVRRVRYPRPVTVGLQIDREHVHAGGHELLRHRPPDPARRAGHERGAAGEMIRAVVH